MPETTVWVRFTSERFHRWPDAPPDSLHSHLRHEHRHLFHVEVAMVVEALTREVSFEQLRAEADDAFDRVVPRRSTLSCEQMADYLASELRGNGTPVTRVTVSEDGESGATWQLLDQDIDVLDEPPY